MKQISPSFKQVFEAYVFKMASQYIESADSSTQDKLIGLLGKVADLPDDQPPASGLLFTESAEWEQVLSEPVDWNSVHQQWRLSILRAHANRHRGYMTRLEEAAQTTRHRLAQVQVSQLQEPRRSQLVAYYKQTLASCSCNKQRPLIKDNLS